MRAGNVGNVGSAGSAERAESAESTKSVESTVHTKTASRLPHPAPQKTTPRPRGRLLRNKRNGKFAECANFTLRLIRNKQ